MSILKNDIYVLVQPSEKEFFWVTNILTGMKKTALRHENNLCIIAPENFKDLINRANVKEKQVVLIVGYTSSWVKNAVIMVSELGHEPMIVGACMHPALKDKFSGIEFSLSESVEMAVNYLLKCGCMKTALLGVNNSSIADKVKEKTVNEITGVLTKPEVFVCKTTLSSCVDEFLRKVEKEKYDGVLCVNDTVAVYLINRLRNIGKHVPEDIKVIGIGNSNIGQRLEIPLTSIDLDYLEMGRQAVRAWRFIKKNNDEIKMTLSLPCSLIVRESTSLLKPPDINYDICDIVDGNEDYYYDPNVQSIIKAEAFLGECDEADREILYAIAEKLTYAQISEKLNMTDRAIKYRVAKLMDKAKVKKRSELFGLIKPLIDK